MQEDINKVILGCNVKRYQMNILEEDSDVDGLARKEYFKIKEALKVQHELS